MKILQLCLRVPFPPADGGNIAMLRSAEGLLATGNEVHIAALNTPKHYTTEDKAKNGLKHFHSFFCFDIDTEIKVLPAFINLFQRGSYNIERFYSKDFEDLLIQKLMQIQFDIVQLESIFMLPYIDAIRKNSNAQIVLRTHNVEHVIWEQLAEKQSSLFKRSYLNFLASRLKKYELEMIPKVDAIIAISKIDSEFFKNKFPEIDIHISPVSLADPALQKNEIKANSVFHLGSMDWLPNVEAIHWFLKNVWPIVTEQCPDCKLFLAGRKMPESISSFANDKILIEGFVENSSQFMQEHGIMIVPVLSGSGIRVKIIEGLALGIPMLSTSQGAEGISVSNGKDICIADSIDDFAHVLIDLLKNKSKAERISEEARKTFQDHYSLKKVGKDLNDFYAKLLSK